MTLLHRRKSYSSRWDRPKPVEVRDEDLLPLESTYGNFTIKAYQWWHQMDLFYVAACDTCDVRVVVAHEHMERLNDCPACRFKRYVSKQEYTGTYELKSKAIERYKEHIRACTFLDVPYCSKESFWHEILEWPELADRYDPPKDIMANKQYTAIARLMRMHGER